MTYTERQLAAAIELEVLDWAKFFGIEPTPERLEVRRLFHRANLACNHIGELDRYLHPHRSAWIENNKTTRPFAAGALTYIIGRNDYYGCHYGMRSTAQWARDEFSKGYETARRDEQKETAQ